MRKRAVGLAAAGVGVAAAAAALAFAGNRARARRLAAVIVEPRGEAHMWAIVGGFEPAEQLLD
jgi:hypothetical protein